MKTLQLLLLFFCLTSCSFEVDVTLQDDAKGAALAQEVIDNILNDQNINAMYNNAHEAFKQTTPVDYRAFIDNLQRLLINSNIVINAYETFGSQDSMAVYAQAKKGETEIHVKISLWGDKLAGYELYGINFREQPFAHGDGFAKFDPPLKVN